MDNVIACMGRDGMGCLNLDVIFIQFKFEKAYDRIEWPFILPNLIAFGFRKFFLGSIETHFVEASTFLPINK